MNSTNSPRILYKNALLAGFGACLCITVLGLLGTLHHVLWLMAPFGATMVILFALPGSPLAQPRNIIAGHLLTALVGLLMATLWGVNAWSLGAAVGLSVMLMMLTHTIHPPAGANPLLIMLAGEHWTFLFNPVAAGTLVIVLFGYLYHRFVSGHPYPVRWF
ncbi:HPP family protein [Marinobacterium marinum]|uniref:HPP family protein n=1 Tax=Marinobacterium marinum TaxID=2756129 RepID=A0A7W2ACZ7_9GAMM|nr:HPP family protein [Marinobacterium marinum]MBA4502663.1 HPP family protein [Marinobacterium marinum]